MARYTSALPLSTRAIPVLANAVGVYTAEGNDFRRMWHVRVQDATRSVAPITKSHVAFRDIGISL
jgi:hypothetical protein